MIKAEFNDFEEMVDFAKALLGISDKTQITYAAASPTATEQAAQKTIVPPVVTPVQSVPAPVTTPISAPVHAGGPTAAPAAYAQVPVTPPVQTASASYVIDDLARAAMTLMDSGRQSSLQDLLKSFGVEALPALPQAQYGAFATALRGMGAQI